MAGQEIQTDRVVDFDQYHRWNRHMFVRTQLEILQSRRVLMQTLQTYADESPDDPLKPDLEGVEALLSMVEVKPRQGTELIDLSILSDEPSKIRSPGPDAR